MTITMRAAALLTAAALALTGCTSGDKPGSTTIDQTPTSSATPTEAATPEPKPESAPAIRLNGSARFAQEISGIVSWEVQNGKAVNAAVAKKVSPLADAFINEHLLRPDRWQGKYAVKAGEMDAAKAKTTPKMYGPSARAITWWHTNVEKYGPSPSDWPKKQAAQSDDMARSMGGLLVTNVLADGGKGPIKNEMTRKVIYPGDDPGEVLAYVAVTGRRANNTGARKSITAKVGFTKVDGRWLVNSVYWSVED